MVFMAPDSGLIDVDSVPFNIINGSSTGRVAEKSASSPGFLEMQERESILRVLQDCGGNIRATAQKLGISRSGLYVKMKKFGISPDECR